MKKNIKKFLFALLLMAPILSVSAAGECDDIATGITPIISFVKKILQLIQFAVPIILIIYGTIDLAKAITAGKDDEIKKGQQTFVKRAIAAVLVFFVVFIVQITMGLVGGKEWIDCWTNADASWFNQEEATETDTTE